MNVQLALDALEDAKAHPENFYMGSFFGGLHSLGRPLVKDRENFVPPCGTTACYAGFVSLRVAPVGSKIADACIVHPDGQGNHVHVETYATNALDITAEQAGTLFYLNDIEEVEGAVKYLADNPDTPSLTLWEMFHDGSKHHDNPYWDDL